MHRQDNRPVSRALVEIVDAEGAAVLVVDLDVVRCEGVAREISETLVGCAE